MKNLSQRLDSAHRAISSSRSGPSSQSTSGDRIPSLVSGVVALCLYLLTSNYLSAQCTPAAPEGRFEGSATSAQAGRLDISLNLACENGTYQGDLVTPLGTYKVVSGSFEGGNLKLRVTLNGNDIAVEANVIGERLQGTFASADDKGPVELHRSGAALAAAASPGQLSLTAQQWREDIAYFAKEMIKRHPDPFAFTPKEQFDGAVAELNGKAGQLNTDEMFMGLDRLANLIGDAHTYVKFPADNANVPLDIRRYGDEWRVRVVGPGYEQALGARVIAIQDTPWAKATEIASTVTPVAETAALRESRVADLLTTGMALHGLGIISDRDAAQYTLAADDGRQFVVNVRTLPPGADLKWVYLSAQIPLSEQPVKGTAACTFLAEAHTLYCDVRMIRDLAGPGKEMLEILRREHPDKVVIDLRQNGGGDYNVGLKYLIEPLKRDTDVNRKGHLFVLIGTNTFSAAMSNAAQFRTMTEAMLVGEAIGEKPNSYQEPREFTLPNSRFVVRYSTRFYKFVEGTVNLVAADKEIVPTWDEYKNGRDPVLEWVLAFK
jgi:hypothetical protein